MMCLSLSETREGHLLLVLLLLLLLLSLLGTGHWVNSCACSSFYGKETAPAFLLNKFEQNNAAGAGSLTVGCLGVCTI
jgi:hypothetical protein